MSGFYPRVMETNYHRKTCSRMFIPTLFMMVKKLKNYICLSLKLYCAILMYLLVLLSNKIKSIIDRLNQIGKFRKYYGEYIMYDYMNFKNKQN